MRTNIVRSAAVLGALLVAGATASSVIHAQMRIPGIAKGKDKDEEAKLREKEKAKADKDARRYDKLKAFSVNLYQTDPEFREDVDNEFDELQRQHSIDAFHKNVASPARPTVVHDGDRLRLQTGLYDNKLVGDYINRVGQRLVPPTLTSCSRSAWSRIRFRSPRRSPPAPSTSRPGSSRCSTTKRSSPTSSGTRWRTCSSITGS